MAIAAVRTGNSPLGDINTTPLIDVMLVLLVMLVITIPVATHSIDVELPGEGPIDRRVVSEVRNEITVTQSGNLRWNGSPIERSELPALIGMTLEMPIEPQLQFRPDANAPYDISARTIGVINISGVTNFGFVGNENYENFGK